MDAHRFLIELRDRGVYRVAGLYAAGAFTLLEAGDMVLSTLELGDVPPGALVLAAVGFPISLVLAWIFDLTADGIIQPPPEDHSSARPRISVVQAVEMTLIAFLVLLVGYLYAEQISEQPTEEVPVPEVAEALPAAGGVASIAVMPFINMSDNQELEYFGDGLAEEILNLLAKLEELKVAARTSSFQFKGKQIGIPEIGASLGVEYVLEGSVRRAGETIRVTAQLIDARTGYHLWSHTYQVRFDDVLSIQDSISGEVVHNLKLILSPESEAVLAERVSVDPRAYDYYLQGRDYLRRSVNSESLAKASGLFEKALELSPDYGSAYAGLCDAFLAQYHVSSNVSDFELAEKACHRAITLDERAVPVYVALGNLYRGSGQLWQAEREFQHALKLDKQSVEALIGLAQTHVASNRMKRAEESFLAAIQLQPHDWRGYNSMGNYLFTQGRAEEAVPYYERITELMPDNERAFNNLGSAHYMSGNFTAASEAWRRSLAINPGAFAFGNIASSLFFLRRFDEAIEYYHKAVELTPDDAELWGNLGNAYRHSEAGAEMAQPMYQRALELAAQELRVNPSDPRLLALMGEYYANTGDRERALDFLQRAGELAPDSIQVYYERAVSMAALGDQEQSLAALERALRLGYPWELAKDDASFDQLASLPRYQDLVRQQAVSTRAE